MAHPGGRPTDYKPEFCEQAATLCANGATDQELADYFEVHLSTYYRWRALHPEFREAVRLFKEVADERVERSLFHRAVGYEQEAVKIFMPAGADAPVYAQYRERIAPDTAAATFWLKNRKPDEWRDKHEFSGKDGAPLIPVINLTIGPESAPAFKAGIGVPNKRD
jgi:hypothetical protein